jgi:hypothetical protein
MSLFEINIRTDVERFGKTLDDFARRQLPFATALAITALARKVQAAETAALPEVFDRPTPFTMRAVGVVPATKRKPEAIVFIKDIQAAYLAPYEFGGKQIPARPGNVAVLTPKAIRLNQYGNIPYGAVARLKGKGNTFVGAIKSKSGETISGVWQRQPGPRGGRLRMLVRFTDPREVTKHFQYHARAEAIVRKNFEPEMRLALQRAIATAHP